MDNEYIGKNLSVRIPRELLEKLKYIAKYKGRSLNAQILYLIRMSVLDFKREHSLSDAAMEEELKKFLETKPNKCDQD